VLVVVGLLTLLLLALVYRSHYGDSLGVATALFLTASILASLFVWGLLVHLHPSAYWRPVSPYIVPGWDQVM
jgi:hypothetical protein